MLSRHRWLSGVLVLVLGCASAPSQTVAPVPSASATPSASVAEVDPVEARANELVARATALEPTVTPEVKRLAAKVDGEMVKLEYRLKTAESTARKLRLELEAQPDLDLPTVTLGDSLRYTMVVNDTPAGHYVAAVHDTLEALEGLGHAVEKVKNYWPRDDNYSGINTVLHAPDGLPWELQFHTPSSLQVQADTRAQYEELRLQATPLERKRELFERMTEAWNVVPLPEGILEPSALHEHEEIKTRARP